MRVRAQTLDGDEPITVAVAIPGPTEKSLTLRVLPEEKSIDLPMVAANMARPGVVHALGALHDALRALHRSADEEVVDPIIETLEGIVNVVARGRTSELSEPVAWSRRLRGLPQDRAEVGAAFVEHVKLLLAMVPAAMVQHLPRETVQEHLALNDGNDSAAWLRKHDLAARYVVDRVIYWIAYVGRGYEFVAAPIPDRDDALKQKRAMEDEIRALAKRERHKPEDYAIALLRGWGLSKDEAHARLKYT
jgi:hypothetical protein